jgi:hypothetical protein
MKNWLYLLYIEHTAKCSPKFRSYLSKIWLLELIAFLIVFISITSSYTTGKWHWFGRSGAWLTIIGVILSARPLIRMGFNQWLQSKSIIDLGSINPTIEEIEKEKQENQDNKAFNIGIKMSIIGTLIWAYGDLIGEFL